MANPDTGSELYLDLLEKVIINQTNPENGARIKYLVDLLSNGWPAEKKNKLIAALVLLPQHHQPSREALRKIYETRNWWTMNLGFPFSMIGPQRLANVRYAADTVLSESIPGAMVETGVWRGGACMMMKAVMRVRADNRPLYVCDSFRGLPKVVDGVDASLLLDENPLLTAPVSDVRSHFERLGLLDEQVFFVEGWFKDTMPILARSDPRSISLLRLDGDYYESTIVVLDNLYSKVSPGGFIIIDDYFTYTQCAQAVDDFRSAAGIQGRIIEIDEAGVYWRREATG